METATEATTTTTSTLIETVKLGVAHLWDLLLLRNEEGGTLMGLLEATAVKLDRKCLYTVKVPELYPTLSDMVLDGISKFGDRKVLEQFDPELAGGWQNFPGYLAARWTGIVKNAAQDAMRKKSIRAEDVQEESFLELQAKRVADGKKPLVYAIAARTGASAARTGRDGEEREPYLHGSIPKDWAGKCEWDATDPQGTDAQAAASFRGNILWHLTPEEAEAAQLVEAMGIQGAAASLAPREGDPREISRATNRAKEKIRTLLASARLRLAKAGISAALVLDGHIV